MCGSGRPRRGAAWRTRVSGERRLRSMSTARAFSGEMYSTRQRCRGSAGTGSVASLSIAHRNAASVLPDPVGALTSAFSPLPIDTQACACACVGSAKAAANHALVASLKPSRAGLLTGAGAGIYPSCLAPPTACAARANGATRGRGGGGLSGALISEHDADTTVARVTWGGIVANIISALDRVAGERPGHPAVRMDDLVLDYSELREAAGQVTSLLSSAGAAPGDRVGIMLPNVPAFPMAFYGALAAGAVVVPMNPLLKSPEGAYYLGDSGAKVLFAWYSSAGEAAKGAADTGTQVVTVDEPDMRPLLAGPFPRRPTVSAARREEAPARAH